MNKKAENKAFLYKKKKILHQNQQVCTNKVLHLLAVLHCIGERERELEGRKMLSGPLSLVNLQWVSFIFILLD